MDVRSLPDGELKAIYEECEKIRAEVGFKMSILSREAGQCPSYYSSCINPKDVYAGGNLEMARRFLEVARRMAERHREELAKPPTETDRKRGTLPRPGTRYGHLTIVSLSHRTLNKTAYLNCLCDCGAEKVIAWDGIRNGLVVSCGHVLIETARQRTTTHGESDTPLHSIWRGVIARCKPNYPEAHNYYDRGIRVCERWQTFENFKADMGERPSDKHSIDRIDNNGNYEPRNCRWATAKEQLRNTRRNRIVTFQGVSRCVTDWAEQLGFSVSCLKHRLNIGWSVEAALTTPTGATRRSRKDQ